MGRTMSVRVSAPQWLMCFLSAINLSLSPTVESLFCWQHEQPKWALQGTYLNMNDVSCTIYIYLIWKKLVNPFSAAFFLSPQFTVIDIVPRAGRNRPLVKSVNVRPLMACPITSWRGYRQTCHSCIDLFHLLMSALVPVWYWHDSSFSDTFVFRHQKSWYTLRVSGQLTIVVVLKDYQRLNNVCLSAKDAAFTNPSLSF